jgi:Uma2 family endonuclease
MVSQLSKPISKEVEIIYPESDGKPMADNTKQFELIVEIKKGLDWLYLNDPQVFVAGDLFWYPIQGQNTIVTAPDVMVVFGRPKGDRGSYRQWQEDNIAPQVVFEILSPSNSRHEMSKKLLFFDRYNVEEYYLYDPETRATAHVS